MKQTENARPLSTRDALHSQIVFDLIIPTESQQTAYLRFQNGDSMTMGLTILFPTCFYGDDRLICIVFHFNFGVKDSTAKTS